MAYTALMTKDEIGFENNTNTITTVEIGQQIQTEALNRQELYQH